MVIVSFFHRGELIKLFFFMNKLISTLGEGCIANWKRFIRWFNHTVSEPHAEEGIFCGLFITFVFDVNVRVVNATLIFLVRPMHWRKLTVVNYRIWWVALVVIKVKFFLNRSVKWLNNTKHIRSFFTQWLKRINFHTFLESFLFFQSVRKLYLFLVALKVAANIFQL